MLLGVAKSLTALVALLWLLSASSAAAQPNIILIVSDDQRAESMPYMATVRSELIGKGVRFANSFTAIPNCCPSRSSLFTGLYPHSHGVWANSGEAGGFGVFRDRQTLPVWLNDAGYETLLIGKYLNRYGLENADPAYVPPGWDRWFPFWGHNFYFDWDANDNGTIVHYGEAEAGYSTDVLAAEAREFILASPGEPFFLYFAPKAPHITQDPDERSLWSVDPAPRHVDAFQGFLGPESPSINEADVSDKPRYIRRRAKIDDANLAELREEQMEALLAVDEALAGMIDALEVVGELESTIIIYTSDNGYSWGEHRWRQKNVPYEESVRVPLVVRYDEMMGQERRVERRLVSNVDLAPTLTRLAGAEIAPNREGRNLVPLLRGRTGISWRKQVLSEHGPGGAPGAWCMFRGPRWKYVQYESGEEELYDLANDPDEMRNLAKRSRYRERIMNGRRQVLASRCRPPNLTPLKVVTS
jgi:N-acetylglucosamine-6-sulfatase